MSVGIGEQIANRLKQVLPKYTDDFSDILGISSLSRSGSTITAVSASAHGLSTGEYVMVRGAKEPITLTSLTRDGSVVTAVTSTSHKLTDPSKYAPQYRPLYVEISGASPSDYNGTFELISVSDDTTFTFKITTTPSSPASTAGYLLLSDYDGYNGFKQVTVLDTTTFTYTTTNTGLETPAQGTIEISLAARIDHAATPSRILDFYSAAEDQTLKTWAFVVINEKTIYKDGTVANDVTASKNKNDSFWYEGGQGFSIYVVLPAKDTVLGGVAADQARLYEKPILKAVGNFVFQSDLAEGEYQPVSYVANESDDYIKAYYSHRFDFLVKGLIQNDDTADLNPGVPFQLINATVTDKQMTIKPSLRS